MDGRTAAAALNVAVGATKEEIASAFRAKAKRVHPDVDPGNREAAEDFRVLREAYEYLLQNQLSPEVESTGLVNAVAKLGYKYSQEILRGVKLDVSTQSARKSDSCTSSGDRRAVRVSARSARDAARGQEFADVLAKALVV